MLGASAFLLASACGHGRATGYPGYALIALAGENSVAAIDLNTFKPARKLDFPAAPTQVLAGPQQAYLLTPSNGTVYMIDPATLTKRGSLRLGDTADKLRLTPDGRQLIAVCRDSHELVLADTVNGKVTRRYKLAGEPVESDMRLTTDEKKLFVVISQGTSGVVESIDLKSGNRQRTQISGEPGKIRLRSDAQLAMTANRKDNTLVVLDTATLGTVCELPLPMRPDNLAFSFDMGQLFISGEGMDGIAIVFPFRTIEVEQTILAGRTPGVMACSDSPSYLFVASRTGPEVSILNVDTRKLVALTNAGDKPCQITITPDQQYALVLNENSGDMAVIRIPSIRSNRMKSGAALFAMVPLGMGPADMAVYTTKA
jgi:DNA-binding beta-propeller fold protein YncE